MLGKAGFIQVNIIFTNELSSPVNWHVQKFLLEKYIQSKKLKFLSPKIDFILYYFLLSKFFNANKAILITRKNTNFLGKKTVSTYFN